MACDMLTGNSQLAQLTNNGQPLHVEAAANTPQMFGVPKRLLDGHSIYECQVGVRPNVQFHHGVEGGIVCGPSKWYVQGDTPVAPGVYEIGPRFFAAIASKSADVVMAFFLDVRMTRSLVISALHSAAQIVNKEGCPASK